MKIGAVIVAAGMGNKKGECKPMFKIGSISAMERIIYTFQQGNVNKIVVVTGSQAEIIEKHLSGTGIIFLRNERYMETEMFDSALIGLDYLKDYDRIFFTPADVPLFSVDTVKSLLNCNKKICIPVYEGSEGHPLLICGELIDNILRYDGSNGMRGALNSTGYEVNTILVKDKGILLEMDQSTECKSQIDSHNKQLLRPVLNVSLAREEVFFDKLDIYLLEIISDTNSVKLACDRIKISYSSAWKKLKLIEKSLGKPVVITSRGGIGGGYTELTIEGYEMLKRFRDFEKQCQKFAEDNFYNWFDDLR